MRALCVHLACFMRASCVLYACVGSAAYMLKRVLCFYAEEVQRCIVALAKGINTCTSLRRESLARAFKARWNRNRAFWAAQTARKRALQQRPMHSTKKSTASCGLSKAWGAQTVPSQCRVLCLGATATEPKKSTRQRHHQCRRRERGKSLVQSRIHRTTRPLLSMHWRTRLGQAPACLQVSNRSRRCVCTSSTTRACAETVEAVGQSHCSPQNSRIPRMGVRFQQAAALQCSPTLVLGLLE